MAVRSSINWWNPSLYDLRTSRIDLKADFIDEGLSVDGIYRRMEDGSLASFREQLNKRTGNVSLRRSTHRLKCYSEDGEVQTIELGSKKPNVNVMLRIYDKRAEQMGKKGVQYTRACECGDWVRFELVLRHEYARQFTDRLLECEDGADQARLIAATLDARHRFTYLDDEGKPERLAPWSADIAAAAQGASVILSAPSWRTSELEASLGYIVEGSGLYALLWKADATWGIGAREKLLGFLLDDSIEHYEPNQDALRWFRRYRDKYRQQFPTIEDWLADASKALGR